MTYKDAALLPAPLIHVKDLMMALVIMLKFRSQLLASNFKTNANLNSLIMLNVFLVFLKK
jgi:hypothetical protein